MSKSSKNLKRIMDILEISNISLARSISVDASLISRWQNGQRQLKLSSTIISQLSEYLLEKIMETNKTDWLKQQIELDGMKFDYASTGDIQKALMIWLSSDGENVSKTLDLIPATEKTSTGNSESPVKTGFVEIVLFLERVLDSLPDGSKIDIHLSSEEVEILFHETISRMLLDSMLKKHTYVRLLVSMSSGISAMSQLVSRYMQAIIEGHVNITVVHSITQAITNQTTFIFENEMVFMICETPKNIAPPIGTSIYEASFVKESRKSFERAYKFSQPLTQRYNESMTRHILEIFFHEYNSPGDLDVIKDNINPLYMCTSAFEKFVKKTFKYKREQLRGRCDEFSRIQKGASDILEGGSVFREIISLKRINLIIQDGYCKMPGLYFMANGIVHLDPEGCKAVFEGCINYLSRYPNFHIVIIDDIPELSENTCWHLKHNHHWLSNGWNKDENITLYTDQLMLTHEFQARYNEIWSKLNYSEGRRKQTISVLQDSIEQLRAKYNLD